MHEISELRAHNTPEEAWTELLRHIIHPETGKYMGSNLYLFNGVRKWTEGYVCPDKPNEAAYVYGANYPPGYGKQRYKEAVEAWEREQLFGYAYAFAKFLKANKLGQVIKAPYRQNANYKGHLIEAYIWCPDVPAVMAWRKKNRSIPPAETEAAAGEEG